MIVRQDVFTRISDQIDKSREKLYVTTEQFIEIKKLELTCETQSGKFDDGRWISGLRRICGSQRIEDLMYKEVEVVVTDFLLR